MAFGIFRLGAVTMTLGSLVASASAQAPEPIRQPATDVSLLPELIKKLDAPEALVRIEATEAIFQAPTITLKQIEAALRAGSLSAEQRQRLFGVAARRFYTEPRAAMGIQNDGNLGSHGVSLAFLQPGFPAAKVLRLGDRVIAAGGVTIDTWETMRAVIISHDPGDVVPITVVREGATITLDVALGDFRTLRQPSSLDPMLLAEAWRLRSHDLNDPEQAKVAPLESGLTPAAWSVRFTPSADDAADLGLVPGRIGVDDGGLGLVAGGEPRGGVQGQIVPPVVQRLNGRQMLRENRLNPVPGPFIPQDPAQLAAQQQLLQFRNAIQDRRGALDALNLRLADPTLPPADRQALKAQAEKASADILIMNEQIQRLDQLLNPRPVR